MERERILEAAGHFDMEGEIAEYCPFGSGHINDTYRLTYRTPQGERRSILQRMNRQVFQKPEELMENLMGVTREPS